MLTLLLHACVKILVYFFLPYVIQFREKFSQTVPITLHENAQR
jgi:hypothetical protein